MITASSRNIVNYVWMLPIALIGCVAATDADATAANNAASALSIQDVRREIAPKDHGPEVKAVYAYLRSFGYFPNPQLSARHPYWTPVVDQAPKDPSYFGPQLTDAVQAYQRNGGLEPTGVVDAATLKLMQGERCANPDNEFALLDQHDQSEKWNHQTGTDATMFPAGSSITWFRKWCFGPNDGPCPSYVNDANETFALNLWTTETNRTFTHLSSCDFFTCTPSIDVRYYDNNSVPDSTWIYFPDGALGAGWRTSATTAKLAINTSAVLDASRLKKLLAHEFGHILGLGHSSVGPNAQTGQPQSSMEVNADQTTDTNFALMWFSIASTPGPLCPNSGGPCWQITIDDRQSILARCDTSTFPPTNCYSSWTALPGFATDVAVGGEVATVPITWVTSGSNTVWKRTGSGFTQDTNGNGIAIAVTKTGVPWVVNSSNVVRRRSSATCTPNSQGTCAGTWSSPSGGSSARDIAIGGSSNSTWLVTNTASGSDFTVKRWDGSQFVAPSKTIAAQRVTVDSKGFPWVVKADFSIWTSLSTDGSVAWTQVTAGSSCATDIGAGINGGVYAIGCVPIGSNGDRDIWSFDSQLVSATPSNDASVTTWRPLTGFAKRVAVGPDGRPYVVQAGGLIFNLEGT